MILDSQPDLTVVAEAGDGAQAGRCLREKQIDLGILDVAKWG